MNIAELYDRLWDFRKTRVLTVASRAGILTRLAQSPATTGLQTSRRTPRRSTLLPALDEDAPVLGGQLA